MITKLLILFAAAFAAALLTILTAPAPPPVYELISWDEDPLRVKRSLYYSDFNMPQCEAVPVMRDDFSND